MGSSNASRARTGPLPRPDLDAEPSAGGVQTKSALMWDEQRTPFGHIYPQFVWHSEALLIANEAALREIATGALNAIERGRATVAMFASDGEGYQLVIERTNLTGLNYTRAPYLAEYARNNESDYTAALRSRIAHLEALIVEAGLSTSEEGPTPTPPERT